MFWLYLKGITVAVIGVVILSYFDILPVAKLLDPWVLTYILLFAGLPLVLSLIKYSDKKPMIIVDKSGISIRKSGIPFSNLEEIEWTDIAGYTAEVIQSRYSKTYFLTITRKSTSKKYSVDLFDLDTGEDVLCAVERNVNHHSNDTFRRIQNL